MIINYGSTGARPPILEIQRHLAQGFLPTGWGEGFKRRCTSSELTWSLTVKSTQYVHRTEEEWRTIPKRGVSKFSNFRLCGLHGHFSKYLVHVVDSQ